MDEQSTEELDSQNQSTEEVVKTEGVEEESAQDDSEDIDALKGKNEKLFARAKKAEAEAREWKAKANTPKVEAKPVQGDLTAMDTIALIEAKVTNKEDIELAVDYAKFKGISVADALKSSVVKAEIAEKAEFRRSADVANTGSTKRVSTKVTDAMILENAEKGNLPEDPEAYAKARINARKTK